MDPPGMGIWPTWDDPGVMGFALGAVETIGNVVPPAAKISGLDAGESTAKFLSVGYPSYAP
jgi:hypothetical protein